MKCMIYISIHFMVNQKYFTYSWLVYLHLFPPFEPNERRINVNNAKIKGVITTQKGHFRPPSSLSANNTYK